MRSDYADGIVSEAIYSTSESPSVRLDTRRRQRRWQGWTCATLRRSRDDTGGRSSQAGLFVHVYVPQREAGVWLPTIGVIRRPILQFFRLAMDGVFSDFPDTV